MLSHRFILPLVLFSISASAQSVVSARSGVIHYSEGAVFVDDQAVEQKLGRFSEIKQGSELRTENGRAEVLLTPGTFLRIGEMSAIRMISNRLTDTRVEFVRGSAILESVKAAPGTSVVIIYRTSEVRFHTSGLYRFKSEPPEVRVEEGEAEVLSDGRSITVKQGQVLPFDGATLSSRLATEADDTLDSWARRRSVAVAANDAAAAQADDMAVLLNGPPIDAYGVVPSYGVFPYIPMIGGYPLGGYAGYLGLGRWSSPFFVPRLRPYSPSAYSGYTGYRSSYRTAPPIRTTTPVPFHPPTRVYGPAAGSRGAMVSPPAASHSGGVRGGGHR
jgi:hypothetical protein